MGDTMPLCHNESLDFLTSGVVEYGMPIPPRADPQIRIIWAFGRLLLRTWNSERPAPLPLAFWVHIWAEDGHFPQSIAA